MSAGENKMTIPHLVIFQLVNLYLLIAEFFFLLRLCSSLWSFVSPVSVVLFIYLACQIMPFLYLTFAHCQLFSLLVVLPIVIILYLSCNTLDFYRLICFTCDFLPFIYLVLWFTPFLYHTFALSDVRLSHSILVAIRLSRLRFTSHSCTSSTL